MNQLSAGMLAYWLNDDRTCVRVRVELVTDLRVYVRATATEHGRLKGQVWWDSRVSRRLAPREAVYLRHGLAYVGPRQTIITG